RPRRASGGWLAHRGRRRHAKGRMAKERTPLPNLQPILLGVGFALLVVISAATVYLVDRAATDTQKLTQTLSVEDKLSNVLLAVRRAESSQRGYLFTDNSNYLKEFYAGEPEARQIVEELRALTRDNPARQATLDRVTKELDAKFQEMSETVTLNQRGEADAARRLVLSDAGRAITEDLRKTVDAAIIDEARLATERGAQSRQTSRMLLYATLASAALIVLIGAMSVLLVQRSARQRETAQKELETTNANLERIVEYRTADLTALNAQAAEASNAGALEQLGSDFDEAIRFIKTSIGNMDRLINAVLRLSREGRRDFQPEPVDMNALLTAIADTVTHRAVELGASIEVGALPGIETDRLAVEQIFANLVDNALKYGREGEPLQIQIAGRANASHATYEVHDNGRGIDPADHARVFELFRRSGPQDRPGEGIGLAHVRALVRRLGGTMALRSALGQGSTFTVTLPRRWAPGTRSRT